ncbi:penicillin-binding protein activator [Rhodoplanes sp. TEM]|uniref:Penicillin-binding protein activator n=1 Tax=Rhodoplanes tepidamans TaxID=200616 RepID=A0ABT5JE12_RHOTP|nr:MULTISPECIES: penicillin-binding protein activator [Rhodoplanes]MDC7787888.1 penicillin-binding protein activator [Rhodoplanes tepidamans]MDC7987982.1 penicillin-binding protein activator [Rhodoplanes sp. TEM]MDQ0353731.1 ABC-type branched-subunit amino acid transport system substrate-binding protein [Rhodoplanes tepidamans]
MAASKNPTRRGVVRGLGLGTTVLMAGCAGIDLGGSGRGPGDMPPPAPGETPGVSAEPLPPPGGGPATPAAPGQTRVTLILPLSAGGNAGAAAQSMKNAAELALAEFNNPDVMLDVKDDAGTAQGAQAAARQALEEGAAVILGPLFAHAVGAAAQVARGRVPMIAFSTDSNVASRGVYLLSFLPESDVDRIVEYAAQQGKRSFAAFLPDNPYGSVVEAAFKQAVSRRGGRVTAIERYKPGDASLQAPARQVADVASRSDALFLADSGDALPRGVQALQGAGVDPKRLQLIGTGLWDDQRVFSDPAMDGGWFAAPDSAGFRGFAGRYRIRYGQDPVRTATLAYDAVALVAALLKAQGGGRITDEMLTNPSGFAGIDGVFRFRQDGTNQRGLAVLKVTTAGGEVISAAPRTFS